MYLANGMAGSQLTWSLLPSMILVRMVLPFNAWMGRKLPPKGARGSLFSPCISFLNENIWNKTIKPSSNSNPSPSLVRLHRHFYGRSSRRSGESQDDFSNPDLDLDRWLTEEKRRDGIVPDCQWCKLAYSLESKWWSLDSRAQSWIRRMS